MKLDSGADAHLAASPHPHPVAPPGKTAAPLRPCPSRPRSSLLLALAAVAAGCSPDVGLFNGAGGAGGGAPTTTSTTASSSSSGGATTTTSTTATSTSTGGSACGDGVCAPGETPATCPADCGGSGCSHPVCSTGGALVPGCDPCVDLVCGADRFCCTEGWDDLCVGQADALCGAGCCGDGQCDGEGCDSCPQDCGACPAEPSCPHSVCFAGAPLDLAECFDPCVAPVCAATPSCCEGSPPAWDSACTAQAQMLCGPDACVTAVCQSMPSCCTAGWTPACVDLAITTCNTGCDCGHGICSGGPPLAASCNPCVTAICGIDPYCCDTGWDDICIGEVGAVCGISCN